MGWTPAQAATDRGRQVSDRFIRVLELPTDLSQDTVLHQNAVMRFAVPHDFVKQFHRSELHDGVWARQLPQHRVKGLQGVLPAHGPRNCNTVPRVIVRNMDAVSSSEHKAQQNTETSTGR